MTSTVRVPFDGPALGAYTDSDVVQPASDMSVIDSTVIKVKTFLMVVPP